MFRLFSRILGSKEPNKEIEPEDTSMKFLIVGLGNKGKEYDDTRHNIGFDIIDYLAGKYDVALENLRYGWVGKFKTRGKVFVLLKPNTYMNLSGNAIQYWLQKEKIKQENLLVVLDDLNINYGTVRVRAKGSAGGHNGLKHIEQILQTSKYSRVRVGIGNQYKKGQQVDFVLGKWTDEERELLPAIIKHSAEASVSYGTAGLANTMNKFNKEIKKDTTDK